MCSWGDVILAGCVYGIMGIVPDKCMQYVEWCGWYVERYFQIGFIPAALDQSVISYIPVACEKFAVSRGLADRVGEI